MLVQVVEFYIEFAEAVFEEVAQVFVELDAETDVVEGQVFAVLLEEIGLQHIREGMSEGLLVVVAGADADVVLDLREAGLAGAEDEFLEDQVLVGADDGEHLGDVFDQCFLAFVEDREVFLADGLEEAVVGGVLAAGDLGLHEFDQVRRVVVVQVVHVARIALSADVFLEVVVILLEIGFGVEVHVVDEAENLLFAQVIEMNFDTVVDEAEALEVFGDEGGEEFFLHDKVLGEAAQRKSDLHTPLIVIADEIQHRHELLALVLAEAAAQLLNEDGL